MKKWTLILGLPLVLFGCKKDLLRFNMSYTETIVIPSNGILGIPVDFPTPAMKTNSTQRFKDEGTTADKVKDVELTYIRCTITDPSDETFSFLKDIHIYLSSSNHAEVLIASNSNVPNDISNVLELDPKSVKLDKYIKDDEIIIRAEFTTDETINREITMDIFTRFEVTADPL